MKTTRNVTDILTDIISGWKLGTALIAVAISLYMLTCSRFDPRHVVEPLQAQVTTHTEQIRGLNEKVDALMRFDCLMDKKAAELAGMRCVDIGDR